MGATSVTGVSGPGSVSGNQKGSEHMSLSVSKLIGPRIMAAGNVACSGTTGVVYVPVLPGSTTDYIILLQANTANACRVSTALAAVTDTDDWSFTITAHSGDTVSWAIVKIGL